MLDFRKPRFSDSSPFSPQTLPTSPPTQHHHHHRTTAATTTTLSNRKPVGTTSYLWGFEVRWVGPEQLPEAQEHVTNWIHCDPVSACLHAHTKLARPSATAANHTTRARRAPRAEVYVRSQDPTREEESRKTASRLQASRHDHAARRNLS